jgi:phosphoglycolate phosphatase-like HAD superfamily hydrolase
MPGTATMWIRDGVLVNRMHVNAVAFALAHLAFTHPNKRTNHLFTDLINFGFEKSGISCTEKMRSFNQDRSETVSEVESAADFYNNLATEAGKECHYFEGAVDLVKDLKASGAQNFITSAVEQEILNDWANSPQGVRIVPYLDEILGKRDGFTKGPSHFSYVANKIEHGPIYYIADAVSEISTAHKHCDQYHLVPIGFGYVIDESDVIAAKNSLEKLFNTNLRDAAPHGINDVSFDVTRLVLPKEDQIVGDLREAGARHVVTGGANKIFDDLRNCLNRR